MSKKNISRREFIKSAGITGITSAAAISGLASISSGQEKNTEPKETAPKVPTRIFGKTKVPVSMLALGGSQDLMSKELLLRQAVKMGVTYWDTAYDYSNSEEAIGNYFERFPKDREKIFLVTKSKSSDPDKLTQYLQTSMERLKTSYIDLYCIHQISDVKDDLNKETKAWAERAKAKGKIRFFGFSTHKNMESCLMEGARLGWIDGIMASYNYRLMHSDSMKRAVDVCVKAGIGLTAMKTQASFIAGMWADIGKNDKSAIKLTEHFMNKGFTVEQAKLKAVWENPNISTICSEMTNMTELKANVAAALDKTKLSMKEKNLFRQYAGETDSYYCTGCTDICESSLSCAFPVSDVLRYLMYYNSYRDTERARDAFKQIPLKIRRQLFTTDFSPAEKKCPHKLPVAKLMKEAAYKLA